MNTTPSLSSIFNNTKSELASSLSGLVLPKDIEKVQQEIAKYLNKVCDADNEYRQNLTQSEDYILQAALSMLNAQRDMISVLNQAPEVETVIVDQEIPIAEPISRKNEFGKKESQQNILSAGASALKATSGATLLGAGGGALVGKMVLGGWGAVFGAIAGTAITLYLADQKTQPVVTTPIQPSKPSNLAVERKIVEIPVNTEALLDVVGCLCESLDNLIGTFRAQIQRVINKYESQEKPTIEREYRTLLEGIQSLLGYKRGHNVTEDKYVGKLQERIEDLADLLDNYNLEAIDYSEENASWFEAIESERATEIKLVNPAIIKNGNLVIKGKIFIPKK